MPVCNRDSGVTDQRFLGPRTRGVLARRAGGGGTDDKRRFGGLHQGGFCVRVLDQIQEQVDRDRCDRFDAERDRRERGADLLGELDVSDADDRDILGNLDAAVGELL